MLKVIAPEIIKRMHHGVSSKNYAVRSDTKKLIETALQEKYPGAKVRINSLDDYGKMSVDVTIPILYIE